MNIRIIGFPDEIERHQPALDALRAELGDCLVSGPMPVDPSFPGASWGAVVQYVMVSKVWPS